MQVDSLIRQINMKFLKKELENANKPSLSPGEKTIWILCIKAKSFTNVRPTH